MAEPLVDELAARRGSLRPAATIEELLCEVSQERSMTTRRLG
jgi:hypothetical protein